MAEPLPADYDYGGEPTEPKPDQSRPIWTRAKTARLEIKVYEPRHTVGAGEHKEAKRAR